MALGNSNYPGFTVFQSQNYSDENRIKPEFPIATNATGNLF